MSQLTIDGREIPLGHTAVGLVARGLTHSQREILRLTGGRSIRSVEAGVIVHGHRNGGLGCLNPPPSRGLGCCRHAAKDGLAALRRLERRGLVRRTWWRGRWVAT